MRRAMIDSENSKKISDDQNKLMYRRLRWLLKELDSISRYIEIHLDNSNTYSCHKSMLINESCSCIDSIFTYLFPDNKSKNLQNAVKLYDLLKERDNIDLSLIKVKILSLEYYPWKTTCDEKRDKFYPWWDAHNSLKHKYFNENQSQANLENLLQSIGALYILIMYLNKGRPYGKIFSEDDLMHGLYKDDVHTRNYFAADSTSLDKIIWDKVREGTIKASQKRTPKNTP
jgi:hypothetical protein